MYLVNYCFTTFLFLDSRKEWAPEHALRFAVSLVVCMAGKLVRMEMSICHVHYDSESGSAGAEG